MKLANRSIPSRFAVLTAVCFFSTLSATAFEVARKEDPKPSFYASVTKPGARALIDSKSPSQAAVIDCEINAEGKVISAELSSTSGNKLHDLHSLDLVKKNTFTPNMVDGKATSQRLRLMVTQGTT